MMAKPFWEADPDAPYATLLRHVETYCHPETGSEAYETLKRRTRRADLDDMRVFKEELRRAVRDPAVLPEGALFKAGAFEDGTDQAFLDRLWRDLYGDEPV